MKKFNTFEGVLTPCLLSILGVIMYLRLGWVVGSVGLTGALIIIGFANVITLATAFAMSSMVTNIRIGTGGAYSIITKSLGIEAGGAIGYPLYLSQAISVAFYITGFTECWIVVFPQHQPYYLFVSLTVWLFVMAVSYFSTRLAFRIQFVILAIIALSLVSIFLGKGEMVNRLSENFPVVRGNFWAAFAIFFPAATGILTGASMSGELQDPKRSIPVGTISAIAISLVIYVLMAVFLALRVSPDELVANKTIVMDLGRWRWAVVIGIMGATLSSAIGLFVGAPRTLLALSKHTIVPFSKVFGMLILAFGVIFELPLVLMFLTKIGIATPAFLVQKRKYAVLFIFVISAFLTPPDVITQILMAVPLLVLYELGIIFSKITFKS